MIAEAVQYLLRRPELRRDMGKAGREFVGTRYSQDRLADELEKLYLRLAKAKKVFRPNPPLTQAEPFTQRSTDRVPATVTPTAQPAADQISI